MEPLRGDDPRRVGRYTLVARLGAGGMGRVFLGFSPAGRPMAVKVVHPELARDQAFLTRFKQEVAAARRVSGAYTAPVVDAGDGELPWFATTLVPGPSLTDAVGQLGPLTEVAVWRLAAGLAEALADVHSCGLIHRDLKPSNVLLAADGPRVIDFGISRALDGTGMTGMTGTGMLIGTPGFMSPEQASGTPVGPASDVFSLGGVLTFAANGIGPFGDGTPVVMIYRVVHAEPTLTGLSPALAQLVSRCLVKRVDERATLPELMEIITPNMTPVMSATSFWPGALARVIGSYQASFDANTRAWSSPAPVQAEPSPPPFQAGPSRPDVPVDPQGSGDLPVPTDVAVGHGKRDEPATVTAEQATPAPPPASLLPTSPPTPAPGHEPTPAPGHEPTPARGHEPTSPPGRGATVTPPPSPVPAFPPPVHEPPAPRPVRRLLRPVALVAGVGVLVGAALGIAGALTGSHHTSSSSSSSSTTTPPSTSSPAVPSISVADLNSTFSAMTTLKPLAAIGQGNVAAILPDTVSSARYTEFDAPYLSEALAAAGLSSPQFSVQNAQGSDATELTDAREAITKGARVLIIDPLDSEVGASIESYAKSHGVDVIDYDRLTFGGSREYYDSFNNVETGTLIGKGFVACAAAWHVTKPNVLVMRGAPTDNNATLFAEGYDAVLAPYFANKSYVDVGTPAGTWDPPVAESEFQQEFTAHKNINSVLTPNDENAAPIIRYLQTQGVKPDTFPVTGQDATLSGLQNILAGYQCGTVYRPIYLEAQAAVALAMYLRAGQTPPASLVNGQVKDSTTGTEVPSVLLTPEWVTTSNMKATVIADQFVAAQQLCVGSFVAACQAAGISV